MELLSVPSKFFNSAWHDSQLLFSYQSFSRTFLSRHSPKFFQGCEWDFSTLDSSAPHSALKNNRLLSIPRWRTDNIVEALSILSWFWCRRIINPLVTSTSRAFVQDYGVCLCFLSKEKNSVSWKFESFGFGVFYLKPLPYSSSFPTSSRNIFLAPLQKTFLYNSGAQL